MTDLKQLREKMVYTVLNAYNREPTASHADVNKAIDTYTLAVCKSVVPEKKYVEEGLEIREDVGFNSAIDQMNANIKKMIG